MKKAYFYIDDTIWVFRDLAREKPQSLFDNMFMKMLKNAHDKYGLKVQLNVFFRTDSFYGYDQFSLEDMPDIYKEEFVENSDWLKMAFHAFEEFPDYPHINATYKDTYWLFKKIEKEVIRFAGENSFAYTVCPHWVPMSKDAVRALSDCGVKLLDVTAGDVVEYDGKPDSLPYGHALRLLNNRQPETKCFLRGGRDVAIDRSICGYNHHDAKTDKELEGTLKTIFDENMNMHLKRFCSACINLTPYDEIEEEFGNLISGEYIGICDHEQYFYKDYLAYQPDYSDKINKMCDFLTKSGFTFITGKEIIE